MHVKLIALALGVNVKDFVSGWAEGHARYSGAPDKSIIPGSMLKPGTVSFAASQAAVAFNIGLEK